MSISQPSVGSDDELRAVARSVLLQADYVVEDLRGDPSLLLAENPYFLVAVCTTSTISQLLHVEPLAEEAILRRLEGANPGPKRWDAYLILLTQERLPENRQTTRGLFEINYDTSNLRRIAHTGVEATLAAVRQALIPFVAPIELDDPSLQLDPFGAMESALTAQGVERDTARRAVAAFTQGVPLGDVL